jgi:hypothetical protein
MNGWRYLLALSTPVKRENQLVVLVCLVHLVSLVYLVSLVQPNKRDKLNKPDEPEKPDRPQTSCPQSEHLPHVLDRDLALYTGREIFKFEGTVLNAPEPGYFMPQRFEQSSDFTVFPLGQDHFQM